MDFSVKPLACNFLWKIVYCFSSTETHRKKTWRSPKQLLILHTCADDSDSTLSLTESCQGPEHTQTHTHTQAAGNGCEGFVWRERGKQSFALDLINESLQSALGRSAREKKWQSCTYMNYVSGAFVGLGLCGETIFRIGRERQYVFANRNNGIIYYGDGHKCQFPCLYLFTLCSVFPCFCPIRLLL